MRAFILAPLPTALAAGGPVFPYYEFQPSVADVSALNKNWDARTGASESCNEYFQSPISVPKKWVEKASNSALVGTDKVSDHYTYMTDATALATSLTPTVLDPATTPVEASRYSDTRSQRYQFHFDLGQQVSETDASNKKNFLTMPGTGSKYDLLQVHWHFHSEHAVDGDLSLGEIHFVHKRRAGSSVNAHADELEYLVLGAMLEEDTSTTTDLVSNYVEYLKSNIGAVTFDFQSQFSSIFAGDFFRYKGSLTTPPCSEAVEWFLFTGAKYKIGKAAIDFLMGGDKLKGTSANNYLDTPRALNTARPVQPINGRTVVKNKMVSEKRPDQKGHESYNYKKPTMWENAFKTDSVCATGLRQSPVDITTYHNEKFVVAAGGVGRTEAFVDGVYAGAGDVTLKVKNSGHGFTWYLLNSPPEYAFYAPGTNEKYDLAQFHIHFPSEHTIDGHYYPAEIHFVHSNAAGTKYIVLGYFLELETDSSVTTSFLDDLGFSSSAFPEGLPSAENDEVTLPTQVNVKSKFVTAAQTQKSAIVRYEGGLTTPPCSEVVTFLLFQKPVGKILAGDVAKYGVKLGENARPIQPLNSRCVAKNYVDFPLGLTESCTVSNAYTPAPALDEDDGMSPAGIVLLTFFLTSAVSGLGFFLIYQWKSKELLRLQLGKSTSGFDDVIQGESKV